MAKEININELELYFEAFGTANEDIEIMPGVYVLAIYGEKFTTSTIATLRANKGNQNYRCYYEMLVLYYKKCYELNK